MAGRGRNRGRDKSGTGNDGGELLSALVGLRGGGAGAGIGDPLSVGQSLERGADSGDESDMTSRSNPSPAREPSGSHHRTQTRNSRSAPSRQRRRRKSVTRVGRGFGNRTRLETARTAKWRKDDKLRRANAGEKERRDAIEAIEKA